MLFRSYLLRKAWSDFLVAAPFATVGTIMWIAIAYWFHQSMIDALTGGREVTRQEQPRLYNLLENLCISRGITMPKLKVADDPALNAFATGSVMDTVLKKPVRSVLLQPEAVFAPQVKDVVADGFTTAANLCTTAALKTACTKYGVSG